MPATQESLTLYGVMALTSRTITSSTQRAMMPPVDRPDSRIVAEPPQLAKDHRLRMRGDSKSPVAGVGQAYSLSSEARRCCGLRLPLKVSAVPVQAGLAALCGLFTR